MGIFDILSHALSGNIPRITAQEAMENIAKDKKILLIDVREISEYQSGHIPNAKNIPLGVIEKKANAQLKDKNQMLYVYCHSGIRSVQACKKLANMGYTNVYNLGGIIAWPYEIQN